MANLTHNSELINDLFVMPNKLLVTEITYLNGTVSKMVTGIPKGVNYEEMNLSINNTLKLHNNIKSSKSTLLIKENEKLEVFCEYSEIQYTNEPRSLEFRTGFFNLTYGTA